MATGNWLKGSLLLAVTLAAGIAIGVGYERRRATAQEAQGMHHVIHHLRDELGLDSTQERQVAAILGRRQHTVDSTWHDLQPHVRATLDSTLREINTVLRPDQARKFRQMVEAMHPGALP